jgi:transposase InsO family protein
VKDVHSNRIVGYSIDSRMKSRLAVTAIDNAVARRAADGADVAGCIVHSDSEYVEAGDPERLDPHSEGRDRMLVPGRSRAS